MIPFRVALQPGAPIYEQIVYAAKKAIVAGQLRPGDAFPSVRALSVDLKINPNTAHKVITHLVNEGLLEVRPGLGATVADPPDSSRADRARLLDHEVEQLVVEAKKLGLSSADLTAAIEKHWDRLAAADSEPAKGARRR